MSLFNFFKKSENNFLFILKSFSVNKLLYIIESLFSRTILMSELKLKAF